MRMLAMFVKYMLGKEFINKSSFEVILVLF